MTFSPALRRLLHAGSTALLLLIPLGGLTLFRWTLVGVVVVAVAVETLRLSHANVHAVLAGSIPVFRPVETRRPSGATWLAVGYAVSAWLPWPGPHAALLVGGLADPAASLVGSRWSRGRTDGGETGRKTTAGTLAFVAVAGVALLLSGIAPVAVAATAVTAALLERFSGPVDDNLVVPVVAGLVAALVS